MPLVAGFATLWFGRVKKGSRFNGQPWGKGCVNMNILFKEWENGVLKPQCKLKQFPVSLGEFYTWKKDFWPPYSTIRADDYSRFLALARKGKLCLLFQHPRVWIRKSPTKTTSSRNWKKFFVLPKKLGIGRRKV